MHIFIPGNVIGEGLTDACYVLTVTENVENTYELHFKTMDL